jgi:hypothetical protein
MSRDYKDQTLGEPHGQGQIHLPQAVHLLPTPLTTDYNTPASEWEPNRDRLQLRDIKALLPTPAVNDMGNGKTLEWWDEWAPRQKSADGRPAPHGKSLAIEALRMSTALLPTPRAGLESNQQVKRRKDRPENVSNLENALTQVILLGTPTARMSERSERFRSRGKSPAELARWIGDSSPPPSSDGKSSLDDEPQVHLF